MEDNRANKRLAKNTLYLYIRMLFLMIVSLYTSRVTLQVLGVEDFGTYNIVGGVVVLFSFLSRALVSACNRYFSVAVGKSDVEEMQKLFSTSLVAHLFLALFVALVLETGGLWFVVNKLNVEEGREFATVIIYHIAVISVCLNILRIPFHASIIAYEKMNFYAYASIVEGLLRLAIVWILIIIPIDKLISYSILMMITIIIVNIWYMVYCTRKLDGNKIVLSSDKRCLKDILTFSGWNMFGGVADIGWQQGTNVILNLFFGVTLNAAMGITNQIRTAVYSFVSNLQTAANPQIIKAYSNGERGHFKTLVYTISKYSYFLMLVFSVPLIINMDFVLHLWLGTPPEHSSSFAVLILIFSTLDSLSGPLWISIQATGDVKRYSIVVSCILLLNLPATYLLFFLGFEPEYMLIARIVILIIAIIWQFLYSVKKVELEFGKYLSCVIIPIFIITTISYLSTLFISNLFEGEWIKLITSCVYNVLIMALLIYFLGMTNKEREFVNKIVVNKLKLTHRT